jgi:tRNA dimethylallyltransferase
MHRNHFCRFQTGLSLSGYWNCKVAKAEQQRANITCLILSIPTKPIMPVLLQPTQKKIITSLHSEGKIPIICGGTGLYIKALLNGFLPALPYPQK